MQTHNQIAFKLGKHQKKYRVHLCIKFDLNTIRIINYFFVKMASTSTLQTVYGKKLKTGKWIV